MGETNLPAEVWFLVAMIAAGTVVMCLSVLSAAVRYEHVRSRLAGQVRELREHYSLSYPEVIVPVGVMPDMAVEPLHARPSSDASETAER